MLKRVQKRDNSIVDYDHEKIKTVVRRVAEEVGKKNIPKVVEEVSEKITEQVEFNYFEEDIPHVEELQDLVEETLMKLGYTRMAKAYILYREGRSKTRKKRKENSLLSDEFLSKYKHKPNPFPTELGEFIYYRTYSRWLPEEQRREYWWETVKRAVEYNCSLAPTTQKEAEELFEGVYNFKNFLAGRTLWTGGTEASKKYPMSNYNCAGTIVDSFKTYEDLFYLLMIGAGVGVRVLKEDVKNLPPVRTYVKVLHKYYQPRPKEERQELTSFSYDNDTIEIHVGDSKEGWVQALSLYFQVLYRHEFSIINKIMFNYNSVRPKGERLKTFGGTASGHQSIKRMFDKLHNLISKKDGEKVELEPLDALDIANIIGENVVSGGVRRTSEIGLFDVDDEEVKTAKNGLYKQEDGEWKVDKEIEHRQMSNNSIYYKEKPSREQLSWHVKQMRYSGEPGFINAEEAGRRRENFQMVNPCFTGDMKLLAIDGYERLDELAKYDIVTLINKDGKVSNGKVWSNGVKDIVKVSFYNRPPIKCTPDHVFMTNEGEGVEAKNLKGKVIMPYFDSDIRRYELLVKDVQPAGREEVFDFSEPKTHWGVVEGAVVHNCAEILLDSDGMCNLVSLNVMGFVEDGELKREEIMEAQKRNVRSAYRMALVDFELPKWDKVNKRDRLIGLSLTGWQDAMNALDWEDKKDKQRELLEQLREIAELEAERYSNKLNDEEPVLVTTIKPEGTQTQMPTVSSGLHYNHSPYYIRRVRINANDPLVKVAEDLGWNVKNEVGQEGEDLTTKVIEFPVKAPKGKVKGSVSAIEQLETYKLFMESYVDHNASITVHVRDNEWEEVEQWLWDNWDSVVGVSFIPYNDAFYDLMPYEEIEKEEYEEMVENMEEFKPHLVNKYEKGAKERELEQDECENGVCPVR
jgi:ribonucleotide reductase alpha subunit